MRIYTSYFAMLRYLPENIIPISICSKAPAWYTGLQYKKLAPKYDFFMKWKETHDNDYYIKCFNDQVLNKITVDEILNDIKNLAGNADIALICYEKPNDFCHRHLVADWLNKNNILCEEWKR